MFAEDCFALAFDIASMSARCQDDQTLLTDIIRLWGAERRAGAGLARLFG